MKVSLPKIYPITDSRLSGLSHARQVEALIAGGATFIQLREKYLSAAEWYPDALAAAELCRKANVICIVNDRVDLALAIDADGVHLGQDDVPVSAARRVLGEKKLIGSSTHSLEQLKAALLQPVDYVAIGPVFATSTKAEPDPVVGLETLTEAARVASNVPLVAIGGITPSGLPEIFAAGASSAAVISILYQDPYKISACYRELSRLAQK